MCRCSKSTPGRFLPESNAILWYIAGGTPLAPENRIDRAEALQWMFFEQHSLEPNLGAAWFWLTLVKGGRDLQLHAVEDWTEQGYRAFRVMEQHLQDHHFFAASRYTIADIALYAYTHVAHECGFDLTGFPRIRGWLKLVADQPGHITMDWQREREIDRRLDRRVVNISLTISPPNCHAARMVGAAIRSNARRYPRPYSTVEPMICGDLPWKGLSRPARELRAPVSPQRPAAGPASGVHARSFN